MQTIAQQLKITEFPFTIENKNGKNIYYEDSEKFWYKREYDSKNNEIYFEDSNGYWSKCKYNINGKEIYYENSKGHWAKSEYDSNNNEIYYENSYGKIKDNRPKVELTLDEIANKLGINVSQLKIKK
jgi:hypothetical protein